MAGAAAPAGREEPRQCVRVVVHRSACRWRRDSVVSRRPVIDTGVDDGDTALDPATGGGPRGRRSRAERLLGAAGGGGQPSPGPPPPPHLRDGRPPPPPPPPPPDRPRPPPSRPPPRG